MSYSPKRYKCDKREKEIIDLLRYINIEQLKFKNFSVPSGSPNNYAALPGINICARLNFTVVQFLKLIQQFRNEEKK